MIRKLSKSSGPIPLSYLDTSFSTGTAATKSNMTFLSVVVTFSIIANCPASVLKSGLLAKTESPVFPSFTNPYTPTLSNSFGEFSFRSASTVTHNPRIPFIAFSPGIGRSLGQGAAEYFGLVKSTLTGPTASAGCGGVASPNAIVAAAVAADVLKKERRDATEVESSPLVLVVVAAKLVVVVVLANEAGEKALLVATLADKK
mmetsp:Transcript_28088/g.39494  ORF Transcript_28088/g.39494 Transcript_28088/m.39494 type:complete len:202 (+) Transcript_28088:343-948(+)